MAAASPSSTSAIRPRRSRTSPPPPRRRRWASRRAPRSRRPGGGRAAGRRPPRRTPRPSSPTWANSSRAPPVVTRRPRSRQRRWRSVSRRAAAERFATLLREFPVSGHARDAAYYRFRALDVARASDASLTPAYEQALDAYLSAYPRAEGAAEARYLLAELHRGRGDCQRAGAEYGQVGAGPFAARARLGNLECRVLTLGKGNQGRKEVLAALRTFVHDAPDKGLGARAALLGAAVAAGATPPDQGAVVELLDGFEQRYPDVRDLHPRALELRLAARVATGRLEEASRDLDAFLALRAGAAERRGTLARVGRELAARAERAAPEEQAPALALARKVYTVLARESGDASSRIVLADLDLRAGDAAAARALYEEVLKTDGASAEALRGAARGAAAHTPSPTGGASSTRAHRAAPPGTRRASRR